MKKKLMVLSGFVLGLAPVMALAQSGGSSGGGGVGVNAATCGSIETGTIGRIICDIGNIFNSLIPVIVILGIVYFVWGVVSYVIASDEEAKKSGRDRMIYGIIGLAVIVAMWGLVNILISTFSLKGNTVHSTPTVVF